MTRITVNLAPADLKKDGSGLDLPIAVGILVSSGVLQQEQVDDTIFVGELALDGTIRQIAGVLPMILHARDIGRKNIVIPAGNCAEGRLVDGIDVLIPASLLELVEHLRGEKVLDVLDKEAICAAATSVYDVDFAEVLGQQIGALVHDEHAGGVELEALLVLPGVEVIGGVGRDIEHGLVLHRALGGHVHHAQGILPVAVLLLIELVVLLRGDLALGPLPQGYHGVEGLPLVEVLPLGLIVVAGILGAGLLAGLVHEHDDGVVDIVGVFFDQLGQAVLLQVLVVVVVLGFCLMWSTMSVPALSFPQGVRVYPSAPSEAHCHASSEP